MEAIDRHEDWKPIEGGGEAMQYQGRVGSGEAMHHQYYACRVRPVKTHFEWDLLSKLDEPGAENSPRAISFNGSTWIRDWVGTARTMAEGKKKAEAALAYELDEDFLQTMPVPVPSDKLQ